MPQKDFTKLTNEELLIEAKKMKKASFLSALTIGIMMGIIIYSIAVNSVGFFTLIPLFFIYKIVSGPDNRAALKALLKERGLE